MAELEQALEAAFIDYRRLARYYGESGNSFHLGDFYRLFHSFLVARDVRSSIYFGVLRSFSCRLSFLSTRPCRRSVSSRMWRSRWTPISRT